MKARLVAVAALGTILAAGAATLVLPTSGTAQQPAPLAAADHEQRLPGRHVEGRIAFLRAELRITAAQEPQWDIVATTMRTNAQRMDQLMQRMHGMRDQPQSAIEHLDNQAHLVEARANATKSFADAFKPLYQSLTDDQRKSADELFDRRGHGGWRR